MTKKKKKMKKAQILIYLNKLKIDNQPKKEKKMKLWHGIDLMA